MFKYIKIICITSMFIVTLDSLLNNENPFLNPWLVALFVIFLIYIIVLNAQYSIIVAKIERFLGKHKHNKFFSPNKPEELEALFKELASPAPIKKPKKLSNPQVSAMLSALSHELKNPITIILGYSEILDKHKEEGIKKIQYQAKKLESILARLNLATKLDNGLLKLEKSVFRLDEMIEDIAKNNGEQYNKKHIALRLNKVEIIADRLLFESAVLNLIENALKYSKKNIKIVLKKSSLDIIDDGCGIPKKEISLVTKKFYRASTQHSENSLGLGLFIAKYIFKLHGIEMEIKSKVNKGSCFSIKLPKSLIVSAK